MVEPFEADAMPEEGPTPGSESEAPFQRVIDSVADLLQMAADWLRQEAGDIVRERVVLPIQKAGYTVGAALASGCLAAMGLIFIGVALFIWLGQAITYPGALALIGVVYIIGAAIFMVIKIRTMQR